MLHHGHYLETIIEQAKQNANSHIVDSGFHGAVQSPNTPVVIALFAANVYFFVGFAVVGFLKNLIRSNTFGFGQLKLVDG